LALLLAGWRLAEALLHGRQALARLSGSGLLALLLAGWRLAEALLHGRQALARLSGSGLLTLLLLLLTGRLSRALLDARQALSGLVLLLAGWWRPLALLQPRLRLNRLADDRSLRRRLLRQLLD
jgi:hypothetical protein